MNFLRNGGLKKFAAIFSIFLLAANVSFGIPTLRASLTLQIVGNGTVSPNYNGQFLNVGQSYSVTAKAKANFTFTGWTGDATNSKPKLTFVMPSVGESLTATFVDKQKPTLTVKTPANSTALTNPAIVIVGTARDNDAVATVFCNLNDGSWSAASTGNGWSNWWMNLTLQPNTNTLLTYAVDRSGNCSKTNRLKLTYVAAPTSLNGMLVTVTNGDTLYNISFGSGTFSDETGVGSYVYKKSGPVAGKLQLKYTAPPSAVDTDSALLTFTNAVSGIFTNGDGVTGGFTLTTATNLALSTLSGGADILLADGNDTNQTLLSFLTPPDVLDNGSMFDVANPLVISLSVAYPGQIGDRVSVVFSHLQLVNGSFTLVAMPTFIGTVIAINASTETNTTTILFDSSAFLSRKDLYAPSTGASLSILSYEYTNSWAASGTGTFVYSNYSPVGSLLKLKQDAASAYYILNFTNLPSTNALNGNIGNFYVENYGADGSLAGTNSGTFTIIAPPAITAQPGAQTLTNGGTASFNIAATGSQPLTYQWQFNGTNNMCDGNINNWSSASISGSSTTNLTITGASTNDIGNYQVVVANFLGSVTSNPAMLTVGIPPQITVLPQNQYTNLGGTASFAAAATGSPPLHYQWLFKGSNLSDFSGHVSGSLTTNLVVSSLTTNDFGSYQIIVKNNYGSATNNPPAELIFQP